MVGMAAKVIRPNGENCSLAELETATGVAPTGTFYGLEFSHSDTEVFQAFLDHANADLKLTRKRNLLIFDNASWHKSKSLKFGAFEPVACPRIRPILTPSSGYG